MLPNPVSAQLLNPLNQNSDVGNRHKKKHTQTGLMTLLLDFVVLPSSELWFCLLLYPTQSLVGGSGVSLKHVSEQSDKHSVTVMKPITPWICQLYKWFGFFHFKSFTSWTLWHDDIKKKKANRLCNERLKAGEPQESPQHFIKFAAYFWRVWKLVKTTFPMSTENEKVISANTLKMSMLLEFIKWFK